MQFPATKIGMIIGYAKAKLEESAENFRYRVYVTDALKLIAENTAKSAGGSYLNRRYIDIIGGKTQGTDGSKSAEEIVDEVVKNAGLEVINGGCI